jgi:hypothetical protein
MLNLTPASPHKSFDASLRGVPGDDLSAGARDGGKGIVFDAGDGQVLGGELLEASTSLASAGSIEPAPTPASRETMRRTNIDTQALQAAIRQQAETALRETAEKKKIAYRAAMRAQVLDCVLTITVHFRSPCSCDMHIIAYKHNFHPFHNTLRGIAFPHIQTSLTSLTNTTTQL